MAKSIVMLINEIISKGRMSNLPESNQVLGRKINVFEAYSLRKVYLESIRVRSFRV